MDKLSQLNPLALEIKVSDELPKSDPTGKGDLTSPLLDQMRASRTAAIKLLYEKGPVDKQSHVSKLITISTPKVNVVHTRCSFWTIRKLKAKKGPRVMRTIFVV